jgi:hypothetical protein
MPITLKGETFGSRTCSGTDPAQRPLTKAVETWSIVGLANRFAKLSK